MTPKKRLAATAFKKERARWSKIKQAKPVRNAAYLRWIRTQDCAAKDENCKGRIQSHHAGPRGVGQTSDDKYVIALCWAHHDRRSKFSVHCVGKSFWKKHSVDLVSLWLWYRLRYHETTGRELA